MTHYAGQMLPFNHVAAVSPYWVLSNGRFFPSRLASDYHKRHGFRPGCAGMYLMRVPPGPLTGQGRWLVLLRDDPTQPDLPADTPTASAPPTGVVSAVITISAPNGGSFPVGAITVSGIVTANTQLQAALNTNGVIGAFGALTTTGTSYSGTVTASTPGTGLRIRVRATAANYNYLDSNPFTVTALAGDPEEPPSRPQLPQRPKRNT